MSLQKGLVGHWTMDDADTSSGTLYDRSAYDNHGTIKGSMSTGQSARLGDGYYFNASDTWIDAPDQPNYSSPLTIFALIKPNTSDGSWDSSPSRRTVYKDDGIELDQKVNNNASIILWGNDSVISLGDVNDNTYDYPEDQWVLMGVRHDGTTAEMFRDTEVIDTASFSDTVTPSVSADIGAEQDSRHWGGTIAGVWVWDRALSDSEINQLSQMRSQRSQNVTPYDLRPRPADESDNLMDATTWTPGTSGTQGNFEANGGSPENKILKEDGPYQDISDLWYGRSEDTSSSADGGWNWTGLNDTDIDDTKTYRYSVWAKQEYTSGTVYHGTERVSDFNGNYQSNPYYWNGDLPTMGDWYLIVGYNRPDGASFTDEGAIYDTDGSVVDNSVSDYRWDLDGGTDSIRFRTYYYYDDDVGRGARFYDPRLEIIDGNETSIQEMINAANDFSNRRRKWFEGFESENLNRWSVNQAQIDSSKSYSGSYSAYCTNNVVGDYQFSATHGIGTKIKKAEYWWLETSNSTGAGVRFKNSNGNYECGLATDNPEWDIEDGNGFSETVADGNYNEWTRFTVTFNWDAQTFDVDLEQPASNTTYTDTGRPLINGTDVESIEFWEYGFTNWGNDSSIDQWFDDILVER